MEYDANGNMTYYNNPTIFNVNARKQIWDEENRLSAVGDHRYLSAYVYDAGGERAWKLAGDVYSMYINGVGYVYGVEFDKTLYVNPYVVVTDQEYTKHYYIEGERVCTKIGGHFNLAPTPPNSTPIGFIYGAADVVSDDLRTMVDRGIACTEFNPDNVYMEPDLQVMHNKTLIPETVLYFYHPDHLGSSSFITDAIGYATQHLQYLPFGETFVDQKAGSFDSRYKFSAKEKDDETQYSYFGARYYDSDLSVFLSIDRFADKYPNLSSYNYCSNNPINMIDINGDSTFVERTKGGFKVVGGNLEGNDNGIYLKKRNGNYKLVGYSLTPESFYNSEKNIWMGIINKKDNSGRNMLNELQHSPELLSYFINNGRARERYDFKRTNGTNDVIYDNDENPVDYYRGMPLFGKIDGNQIYASARDVGNIGAGYVAGVNAIPWTIARWAFDNYQGGPETSSTQYAQKLGWHMGQIAYNNRLYYYYGRLPSYGGIKPVAIPSSLIITQKSIIHFYD